MKLKISILSNNIVIPFQNKVKLDESSSFSLNKLFTTKSLAEHGLAYLISVYEDSEKMEFWNKKPSYKLIFDLGGRNESFLHNIDVRGIPLYDIDAIALSHWHYDHIGALEKTLKRIEKEIPLYTHPSSRFERYFKRSTEIKSESLKNKTRKDIVPYLNDSKLVSQPSIDLSQLEKLKAKVHFSKKIVKLFENNEIKIYLSGEIPRVHKIEDFSKYFSLQGDLIKEDNILDDKCLIIEFKEHIIIVNGCCHSGLMNTIDYVKKSVSQKRISHIIGGFHMANVSDLRLEKTIEYLENLERVKEGWDLYLFPIHCTGEKFIQMIRKRGKKNLKPYNISVGTVLSFEILKPTL
jgi:7,8-dihydropterin-6-yl-methyl-4-(beta-D-ribofuranosyl)aminobenzene 5'-phosphate synthase